MAFEDDGFLSPDLADWTTATRDQYKDWFELVDDLNREAMKVLYAVNPSLTNNRELIASLLYRRALQSFQGAVLMIECGMISDALSLVRTCAETAFVMGWAANDKKVVDALIEDREHRLTSANLYLNDPENSQVATNEKIGKLQHVLAEVKGRYQEQDPPQHHLG
jgi:hypothetical protein